MEFQQFIQDTSKPLPASANSVMTSRLAQISAVPMDTASTGFAVASRAIRAPIAVFIVLISTSCRIMQKFVWMFAHQDHTPMAKNA